MHCKDSNSQAVNYYMNHSRDFPLQIFPENGQDSSAFLLDYQLSLACHSIFKSRHMLPRYAQKRMPQPILIQECLKCNGWDGRECRPTR